VARRTGQEAHRLAGRVRSAGLADVLAVQDQHVIRQRLTAAALPVGGIAAGEHGHVAVADQRAPSLQVTDDVRAAPSGEGQVTRRGRAAQRADLWLIEVRISVDVQHAGPPSSPQRQHRPEQQRAISAQNNRELPAVQDRLDRVSQ
jgi:hypothetical protein